MGRLETCIPISNLSMVKQLCTLLQAIIFTAEEVDEESGEADKNEEESTIAEPDQLEGVFVFCVLWSIGGALSESSREKFNDLLTKIYVEGSGKNLYDFVYEPKERRWEEWSEKVPEFKV